MPRAQEKPRTASRELHRHRWLLAERVKELQCLYRIAGIYNKPSPSLERVLHEAASALKAAWQAPALAVVRIVAAGTEVRTRGWRETEWCLRQPLSTGGQPAGRIEVCYREHPPGPGPVFLRPERWLLQAVGELTENMLARHAAEDVMRRTAERLRAQKRRLEHRNIALRELTVEMEAQRTEARRRAFADADAAVRPALRVLADAHAGLETRRSAARAAERGLAELRSNGGRPRGGDLRTRLSLRESEVAELVRGGATSKEIAAVLGIAEPTVERHRHNIRRKIGIDGRATGLAVTLRETL